MKTLHALFQNIATASTEAELRCRLMDNLSSYFAVQRWGIYLTDEEMGLISCDVRGVSDRFIERYQKIGKSVDWVLKYVQDYHAPAHEELVFPNQTWKQSQLYQRCCIESDHEHIMTGPIVGKGQLMGTIHFARVGDAPAFTGQDLRNLSAVCLHVSACLANLRSPSILNQVSPQMQLTPREIQIAQLVAQGLTNTEIAQKLWISPNTVKQALKRMFRKVNVSSRTEMVVRLKDLLI